MARCPFATQKILPEDATQGPITPRAVILHTAVDSASPNSSIYPYFARADVGDESHFYVMDNGTIEQYIDTGHRADANVSANGFAISIETEDDGNPAQNSWTASQLNSIIKLVNWCCAVHNIPHRQIGSPTGSGIGWHSMWGFNTPTKRPNPWTNALGKTCPGGPRILQMSQVINGGLTVVSIEETTPSYIDLVHRVADLHEQIINLKASFGRIEALLGAKDVDWEPSGIVGEKNKLIAAIQDLRAAVTGGFILTPEGAITVKANPKV